MNSSIMNELKWRVLKLKYYELLIHYKSPNVVLNS